MKTLRRYYFENADYFITCVTYNREPLLINDIDIFWDSWKDTKLKAWVILSDHFHVILNSRQNSISKIIHKFKITYSRLFRDKYRTGRVWQNRFWDHIIRNQADYNNHVNYIHYNPVKHGLVTDPREYSHSSFSKYLTDGLYKKGWGKLVKLDIEGEFGE